MENEIKYLLNQVGIINRKNAEILNATGGRFNIFRICGVNHYENTHSAIFAELLNPKGSHGLGAKFLESFVELLEIDYFDCKNARVISEYPTNSYVSDAEKGRIDILIESGDNAIIIENKIYAGDQWKQLKRYDLFAQQKYSKGNYQICYLTLEGDNASPESHCNISYKCISYKTEVIDWLEKCVGIAVRFPIVRETLIQYINHLKQLTNQDMDMKNEKEIVSILLNNMEAAQAIYNNYEAALNEIDKSYFDNLEQQLRKDFPNLNIIRKIPIYTGYYPKSVGVVLKEDLIIWLGKDKPNGFFCQLNSKESGKELSKERREIFKNALRIKRLNEDFDQIWTRKEDISQERGYDSLKAVINEMNISIS